MVMFTLDELKGLSLKQLRILANYLGIKYNRATRKDEFIEAIYNSLKYMDISGVTSYPEENSQMSVRVRRIYESQRRNGNG